MTGAGKSWTARRLIEQLAEMNSPVVIFDPHGDYARLHELPNFQKRVQRFSAEFPVFEEDADTIAGIVNSLGYPLTETMRTHFSDAFAAALQFCSPDPEERQQRSQWLANAINKPDIATYGIKADLWLVADLAEVAQLAIRDENALQKGELSNYGWPQILNYSRTVARTLKGIMKRTRRAAAVLKRMSDTNKKVAQTH
jgi:hypothetical protein